MNSKSIVATAALAFVSACASTTNLGAKVDQLKPGVSTERDAVLLMGEPTARSARADGSMLLQWMERSRALFDAKAAHVAVLFDGAGRMVRVTHRFRSDP